MEDECNVSAIQSHTSVNVIITKRITFTEKNEEYQQFISSKNKSSRAY